MSRHQITPAWQTSRGSIVRASGCAVGVPVAGMRVFGETRQNLWVNPSGTHNGIDFTINDDGSLTVEGTSTSISTVTVYTYNLKPGSTYTMSLDVAPDFSEYGFFVRSYNEAGNNVIGKITQASKPLSVTFTVPEDSIRCECGVQVAVTTPVSGTYRVMLNEGSTAEPWCPPGLTSVSELGIVTAGKNLCDGVATAGSLTSLNATFGNTKLIKGLEYTISIDVVGATSFTANVRIYTSNGKYVYAGYLSQNAKSSSFTAQENGSLNINGYGIVGTIESVELMLELGSTATAYEPPAVTDTTHDLEGHVLRSLPDGTRDALVVDGSGAVVLEQATQELDLSTAPSWTRVPQGEDVYYAATISLMGGVPTGSYKSPILCDKLPTGNDTDNGVYVSNSNGNSIYLWNPTFASDAEGVKSWMVANKPKVIIGAETLQTVPLSPVGPPEIPAADAALWAASDVPCDLEATTWTASGAEQGRQQAALVKLAQQVRSTAQTTAALAAQSLEA